MSQKFFINILLTSGLVAAIVGSSISGIVSYVLSENGKEESRHSQNKQTEQWRKEFEQKYEELELMRQSIFQLKEANVIQRKNHIEEMALTNKHIEANSENIAKLISQRSRLAEEESRRASEAEKRKDKEKKKEAYLQSLKIQSDLLTDIIESARKLREAQKKYNDSVCSLRMYKTKGELFDGSPTWSMFEAKDCDYKNEAEKALTRVKESFESKVYKTKMKLPADLQEKVDELIATIKPYKVEKKETLLPSDEPVLLELPPENDFKNKIKALEKNIVYN